MVLYFETVGITSVVSRGIETLSGLSRQYIIVGDILISTSDLDLLL